MEKPVKEILQGLKGHSSRSKQSVVSENLGEIERLISEGVPVAVIWESLRVGGLELTFPSFQTSLHRARKKREGSQAQGNQKSLPPAPSQAQGSQPPARPPSPVSVPASSVAGSSVVATEDPFILKLREELKAFKESIKDLPDRERRQKLAEFQEKQSDRLHVHRTISENK
jgi:hypothetical protein